jgi:hypothetical protein
MTLAYSDVDRNGSQEKNGDGATTPGGYPAQLKALIRTLSNVLVVGDVVELRALEASRNGGRPHTESGYFDRDHFKEMAQAALTLTGSAKGVYFTLNPVKPDLLARRCNRVDYAKDNETTCDKDIASICWLPIDADAVKPSGVSATDEEHKAGLAVARQVVEYLAGLGWPEPLVGDSGNGGHALYRVRLPVEDAGLIKRCLEALSRRFSTDAVKIDIKVCNPARIWKLYGTMARKGDHTSARPHRPAHLLTVPEPIVEVSREQLEALAAEVMETTAAPLPAASSTIARPSRAEAERRAIAYLKTCDPGISGDHGSDPTFRAARAIVYGFDLGPDVGFDLLLEHYNPKCTPPWPEAELRHKCRDADIKPFGKPRAWLLLEDKPSPSTKAGTEIKPGADLCPDDDIATVEDLAGDGAGVEWAWPMWIQLAAVNIIAAEAGTGKTRLSFDLMRRIVKGHPWPDGSPMTLSPDSVFLWVVADDHHDEMASLLKEFDIPVPQLRFNAPKSEPYSGTTLNSKDEVAALEKRIKKLRPAFVFVDTVGNATSKNLCDEKETMEFYKPLQGLAAKYRTAFICNAHLNAAGGLLGRRGKAKSRSLLILSKPDDRSEKLRLEVDKTHAKKVPPLGVTMHDGGNDYDDSPPLKEGEFPTKKRGPVSVKKQEAMDFLKAYLAGGASLAKKVIDAAAEKGIKYATLQDAGNELGMIREGLTGAKVWRLPGAPSE